MIANFKGTLVSVKFKTPDKSKKQDFAPHNSLNIMQIDDDGGAEIIVVKCENLGIKFDDLVGKPIVVNCRLISWQNGNRSGLSLKYIGHAGGK